MFMEGMSANVMKPGLEPFSPIELGTVEQSHTEGITPEGVRDPCLL